MTLPIAIVAAALISGVAAVAWRLLTVRSSRPDSGQERLDEAMRRIDELTRHLDDQTRHLDEQARESRRLASMEFRNIAQETLRTSTETLRSDNSRELDSLLTPLREQLGEFRRAVTDSYVKENASRRSLADQIDRLINLNLTIGEEARNLTSALKGNSKVQGDWGEMVLETLLESAGMKKGVNFYTQQGSDASGAALRDADTGRALRPDVVVLLPDDHKLVIDSKVSLTAFSEYHQAPTDELRDRAARRHLSSVRRHVDELAAKKYQNVVKGSAEHVLMFIPNEGAWMLALSLDPDLWKYAYERHVAIVSPTHIFSVMQMTAQLWRLERQNRNAAEIAKLGGLLYDKFVAFTKDFEAVERNLRQVQSSYDECRRHLQSGGTSLASRAERLRELGVKATRRLDS